MFDYITALITTCELQNSFFSAETSQTVSLQDNKLGPSWVREMVWPCSQTLGAGWGAEGSKGHGRREGGGASRREAAVF